MSETKKTGLELLRVPFPDNQISKLPKPLKKREEMEKIPKATCKVCGGYHQTSMVIHLDYVGHAALTDRLLDVDPNWSWEPMALDALGLPAIDKEGGLWIKLTVCGVTRLGYGDAQGKSGGDAMKERIGDALRNAAMRFGAALDLWHKGDLHGDEPPPPEDEGKNAQEPPKSPPQATNAEPKDVEYQGRIRMALQKICGDDSKAKADLCEKESAIPAKGTYKATPGMRDFTKLSSGRLKVLCHKLEDMVDALADEMPEICQECGEYYKNGACRNISCVEAKPED